jgi:two-component system response regulator HydG
MPALLQAKLLRVLDSGEVLPVGGTRPVRVDVRVVSATNRDLSKEVRAGRFRADLLYRLQGHAFRIPDLREHADDVPSYVAAFLRDECARSGRHVTGVTAGALDRLVAHPWPGNVRELERLVRRLAHEVPHGQPITEADLPSGLDSRASAREDAGSGGRGVHLERRLDPERRRIIEHALESSGWNRRRVASELGMSRTRLRLLMDRLGLSPRGTGDTETDGNGAVAD